jgi:uncharacterized protein (TIGR03437 family)
MARILFSVIRVAVAVPSLFIFSAYGQQKLIPCKYFSVTEKATADPGGGLVSFEIRGDPAQFQPGQQIEYARQCELALETPAPWLTVIDRTPLNVRGYSTVTLRAEPNNVPAARTATLTIGTSRTVYSGALPHPANATVVIEQEAKSAPVANNADIASNASGGNHPESLIKAAASTSPISVTNDASFATQISPGSLVALFGSGNVLATTTISGFSLPLPTSSNGTSVTMNGILCPLVYVSPSQINLQAPMELQPGTATVIVNNNGQSFSTTVQVLPAAPGIFTTDYYASGGLAILQDSQTGALLNANNPAVPGEYLTMYFTGIGPITNNPGTGKVAQGSPSLSQSTSTVSVTVNGIFVQPSYTGLTPGFVGLGQLNFQLPANTPGGNTIPVVLTINGVSGKSVQISVRGTAAPSGPVINSFVVSPSAIVAGQTATLSWSVSNASTVTINNNIGSVALSGSLSVAPNSTTTYTITAINSAGASVSTSFTLTVSSPQSVTLVFTNDLVNDATISVNGTAVGTAQAGQTQQVTLPSQPTMNVTFNVVSTRTAAGTVVGDPISGYYNALSSPTGTVNFTITNYFANTNTYYFAPFVTNTSGTTLEMVVNYGLVAQNECNCTVQSGAGPTKIGYYVFYSNSNVDAFANGSNYTGSYRISNNLASFVQANSGVTNVLFNVFP